MTNEITHILAKLPITSVIHAQNDAIYCWKYERKAKKRLYQSRKHAKIHRQKFLNEQIRKSYHNQNSKKDCQIKCISNAEIQLYMYNKISSFLNPKHFYSISYLDVTKDQQHHQITDKQELETELILFHQKHFSQASQTPFAHKTFLNVSNRRRIHLMLLHFIKAIKRNSNIGQKVESELF